MISDLEEAKKENILEKIEDQFVVFFEDNFGFINLTLNKALIGISYLMFKDASKKKLPDRLSPEEKVKFYNKRMREARKIINENLENIKLPIDTYIKNFLFNVTTNLNKFTKESEKRNYLLYLDERAKIYHPRRRNDYLYKKCISGKHFALNSLRDKKLLDKGFKLLLNQYTEFYSCLLDEISKLYTLENIEKIDTTDQLILIFYLKKINVIKILDITIPTSQKLAFFLSTIFNRNIDNVTKTNRNLNKDHIALEKNINTTKYFTRARLEKLYDLATNTGFVQLAEVIKKDLPEIF